MQVIRFFHESFYRKIELLTGSNQFVIYLSLSSLWHAQGQSNLVQAKCLFLLQSLDNELINESFLALLPGILGSVR
jgi:hypothetical protein